MANLKLHGAFRSGTNFVKTLLEVNYDVQVVATHGGWKHAPVPALFGRGHGWPVIGVVRDPWVWLASLWEYSQGRGGTHVRGAREWRSFLSSPIATTDGGNSAVPIYRYATPVDYWNSMGANLLSLEDPVFIARYEDALQEPEQLCDRIARRLHLSATSDEFVSPQQRTRNMVDRERHGLDEYVTNERFDRTAALRPSHRYSFRERMIVTRLLDADVTAALRYE